MLSLVNLSLRLRIRALFRFVKNSSGSLNSKIDVQKKKSEVFKAKSA